jgi:hypothetical protein
MLKQHIILEIKNKLAIKHLLLSTYDLLKEELKKVESPNIMQTEKFVDNDLLIKIRNVFFILGDKDKFNELDCEIYGYHEYQSPPLYRNIVIYQEKTENSSVPNGRYSFIEREYYEKVEEFVSLLPIIRIYEKEKDESTRKYVQLHIYQIVLNNAHRHILSLFEDYFDMEID